MLGLAIASLSQLPYNVILTILHGEFKPIEISIVLDFLKTCGNEMEFVEARLSVAGGSLCPPTLICFQVKWVPTDQKVSIM